MPPTFLRTSVAQQLVPPTKCGRDQSGFIWAGPMSSDQKSGATL